MRIFALLAPLTVAACEVAPPPPLTPLPPTERAKPAPAASTPAPGATFLLPMRLVGTEPFWGGVIREDGVRISGADRPDASFARSMPVITGDGARWRAVSATGVALDVTLVAQPCSDGMSDRRYPFQAIVVTGAETLRGCAMTEREFARKAD